MPRSLRYASAVLLPLLVGCEALKANSPCTDATWYADDDGDGYGNDATTTKQCFSPDGFASAGGDCDDANANVHPTAADGCDTIDNDCDGETDEDPDVTWYVDADADGFGVTPVVACAAPAGSAAVDGDCDDSDDTSFPGGVEVCDAADNDCDGEADEDATDATEWYTDGDADGFGDDASPVMACELPAGAAAVGGDCDDADAAVGAPHDWYADADGDGFGDAVVTTEACSGAAGSVAFGGDCADDAATTNPAADEICDGADNDCSGAIDDDVVDGFEAWFDADNDGYGDPATHTHVCFGAPGYVDDDTDCDDLHAEAHPGGTETCDTYDNDCDGTADWGVRVGTDYATIQESIDAATDGDTVCIPPGTYYENLTWSSDVSLQGYGDHVTMIDGGGAGSVVTLTGGNLFIHDLTIQNGDAAQGAGIKATDTTVEVRRVGVYANTCSAATCEGTGVYVDGGDVTLFDCAPSSNSQAGTTANRGAGVYVQDADIWLQGFVANANAQSGAPIAEGTGIYITNSAAQIYYSDSDNNTLETDGTTQQARASGMYIADSTLTMIDLYMGDDTTIVNGTTNTIEGGILYALNTEIEGSSMNVTRAIVTSSAGTSTIYGAGWFIDGGSYTMYDGYSWDSVTTAATGYATVLGGGVYAANTTLDLTRVVLDANTIAADEAYGGGMFIDGSTYVLLTSSFIAGNEIGQAGGQADGGGVWSIGTLNFTNVTVEGNTASARYTRGGALYLDGGTVSANNTIISDSVATGTISGDGDFAACNAASLSFTYSDLWNGDDVYGDCTGSYDFTTGTNLMVDPAFTDISAADPVSWTLSLASGSALVDAGDPSLTDPDGTRSDLGGLGGAEGDWP